MTLTQDLSSIQTVLTLYILPICFIFGVIGNFLNMIVFYQKHLRKNSCSVYFISTSVFNLLVMFFGILPIVLPSYLSYDYASYSISYCKSRSYIVHVLLMMSRSSVALASIDRFALCTPNIHLRFLNQYHIAIRLMILVCFLWLVIPIHMLVEVGIQMPGKRCGAGGIYSIIYGIYSAIVTTIPLLIMVIFSSLAIRDLRHVRSRVQPMASNVPSTVRIKRRDTQFIILVISEVVIYFLSTILFPVYSIYIAITSTITKNAIRLAIEGFMRYLTLNFFIYFNSCSIFYIHLLASKAFRQECKQLIHRCLNKPKPNNTIIVLTAVGMSNTRRQFNRIHEY